MKRVFCAVMMVGLVFVGVTSGAGAQDAPPVTYERYDVAFDVRPDGTSTMDTVGKTLRSSSGRSASRYSGSSSRSSSFSSSRSSSFSRGGSSSSSSSRSSGGGGRRGFR